jgi:hypothetical protein
MFAKIFFKNPILTMGILMMVAFLLNLKNRGLSLFDRDALHPTSCKSLLVPFSRKLPKLWQAECDKNVMKIQIDSTLDSPNLDLLREALYLELGNNIVFIAKNTDAASMDYVDMVEVFQRHPKYDIKATTKGKDLSKFSTMREKKFILEHLKQTVMVRETAK